MAEAPDFFDPVRQALDAALTAVADLPDDARGAAPPDVLARLEAALVFSRIVVDVSDPLLVRVEWRDRVRDEAEAIAADVSAATTREVYAADLLDAIAAFPVARGRDLEQAVKDAAVSYQRSVAQRVNALYSDVRGAHGALTEVKASMDTALAELVEHAEQATTELDSRVVALGDKIAAQQTAIDQQLTRHTQAFTQSEGERAQRFQTELGRVSERLSTFTSESTERVEAEVKKIKKVGEDVGVLSSAIALKVTADRYGDEADQQAKIADRLRYATFIVTLFAAAAAVWAVQRNADDTHALIAKLAVSSAFGALATYVATQSSRHRRREAEARELQLQLAAFSPFIAPLEPELQQLERLRMSRRTFGVWTAQRADDPDPDEELGLGPTPLATIKELLQRSRPADAAEG